MTEKHFEVQYDGWRYFLIVDTINERVTARLDTKGDADAFLEIVKFYEELSEENEELKRENEYLQQQIEDLNDENIEIIHDIMFLEEKLEEIEKENE